jgi:nucleoside-diphosphate-sugar epimerase
MMMAAAHVGDFICRHFLPGRRQLLTPGAIRLLRMGRRADTSKAQHELGYRPTSVADAIKEAYRWHGLRRTVKPTQQ